MASTDNAGLEKIIEESKTHALHRLRAEAISQNWGDDNLEALVAFEVIKTANIQRQNLRSMQAWLSVKVARDQLYLAHPPTDEHPDGFGNLSDWLKAANLNNQDVYELNMLATRVDPVLQENGYDVMEYLNMDKYPKLREAMTRLSDLSKGEEIEWSVDEIMEDIERAENRQDIRLKYRNTRSFIADGAVNNLGSRKVLTILADEESVESLINSLRTKVDWHNTSATVEERDHEIVLRLAK